MGKTIALAVFEFLISLPVPDFFIAHYQWRTLQMPQFLNLSLIRMNIRKIKLAH